MVACAVSPPPARGRDGLRVDGTRYDHERVGPRELKLLNEVGIARDSKINRRGIAEQGREIIHLSCTLSFTVASERRFKFTLIVQGKFFPQPNVMAREQVIDHASIILVLDDARLKYAFSDLSRTDT